MKQKQRTIFYPIIFFLGIILMYFQIQVFRNTIINPLIPVSIIVVVAVLSFLIDFKNYKRTYDYSRIGLYLFSFMHYIISFGFITCSIFMLINFYFADQNLKTESYKIVDRTWIQGTGTKYHYGEKQPVFTINYKGKEKN